MTEHIHFLMAITTVVGVIVRIFWELDKGIRVKIARIILILFSGLALSYIVLTYGLVYEIIKREIIGVTSIASGIFAYDVVKFIIDYLPEILRNLINKKFTINVEKKEENIEEK